MRQGHRLRAARGFTLLEVMIALALLGLALTVLIKSAAGNIFNAQQAHMMGIVTDLARGKVYDLEEKLLHDGFSDTEQHEEDQAFTEEGHPDIKYSYKIEVVELPSFDNLQKIATNQGSGSGSGSGSAIAAITGSGGSGSAGSGSDDTGFSTGQGGFENSALGGMLAQFAGISFGKSSSSAPSAAGLGSGSDINATIGSALVQNMYQTFQSILKVSIRKLTLTVKWKVLGNDRDMTVVMFFTDPSAMDLVLQGLGADGTTTGSGSGSGSGSSTGSGSGSSTTTRTTTTTTTTGH